MAQKIKVIEGALEVNQVDPNDPMDILAKVGGFEIGGMAGAILAAAQGRVPVLLDGFITGAAALIAVGLAPRACNYLIASHRSVEVGHGHILAHLGLEPLFDLDLRLGEGTGAVLAMTMVEAAAKILDEMATFEEAGISGAEE
jgi:nicotinate-nucleotide--dimethylbenzimidazole phosphoribosyltransferase